MPIRSKSIELESVFCPAGLVEEGTLTETLDPASPLSNRDRLLEADDAESVSFSFLFDDCS